MHPQFPQGESGQVQLDSKYIAQVRDAIIRRMAGNRSRGDKRKRGFTQRSRKNAAAYEYPVSRNLLFACPLFRDQVSPLDSILRVVSSPPILSRAKMHLKPKRFLRWDAQKEGRMSILQEATTLAGQIIRR
jgi:hypothetical protein